MLAARAGLVPGLPLMHPAFYIRPAPGRGGGRAVGSVFPLEGGMGLRPRIHALMLAALGVAGEDIAAGDVGRDRGRRAGVVALAPGDAPGALDLNKLFIEPPYSQRRRPCAACASDR